MKIFYANSVRRQLSAGTNYWLIIVSPAIPHYTCAVVTGALLVRIGWQRLSVILLLVSHPASGRTPVVCSCYLANRNVSVLKGSFFLLV